MADDGTPPHETTYHVENAPSGRAKCKRCKVPIAKGELRIATNAFKEGADYQMTSYAHPRCFQVPPRAYKGVSPEDFVNDVLEDRTTESLLSDPDRKRDVVDAVAYKPPRASKGGKAGGDESTATGKRLASVRKVAAELPSDDDEGEEVRPSKKAKKGKKGEGEDLESLARAMKVYDKTKADDLKAALRWNLGYATTGNKDALLLRCIDGHAHGRLARCPTCFKGKLWLKDEDGGQTVICKGYFDEDIQQRIPCHYSVPNATAPRLLPWYPEEPSEEEIEAMKEVTLKHEALAGGGGGGGGDLPQELIDAAEDLDWPIDNAKEAAQAMLELCTSGSTTVDLPQDEKRARIAIGKLIIGLRASNPDATAVETLEAIAKEFGMAAAKEEAKGKQKSALAGSCACPANAAVVQAFQELGDLYFKDGNANAGMSYKKAVSALSGLDFEITADNAKGLGKGKTKVAGIGKGSADKMHEFLTTGTIAKLEEKRALHS